MTNWRNEAVTLDPRWAELESWDIVWYLRDGIHHTKHPTMAYYVVTGISKFYVRFVNALDMSAGNTYVHVRAVEA